MINDTTPEIIRRREVEKFPCPVCGNMVWPEDICEVCRWQNTGMINIDGGPNDMDLADAIEAYKRGEPLRKQYYDDEF